ALLDRLTWAMYGSRPSKIQRHIVRYIFDMRMSPAPLSDGYTSFLRAACPLAQASIVVKEWKNLQSFFSDGCAIHKGIADICDVQGWINAFKSVPDLDTAALETAWMPSPPADKAISPTPAPPASSLPHDQSLSNITNNDNINTSDNTAINNSDNNTKNSDNNTGTRSNSNSSINISSSSGGDGGRSSRASSRSRTSNNSISSGFTTLSPNQLNLMHDLFRMNFLNFRGECWTLPSKTNFDEVVFGSTRSLKHESPILSFVIDNPTQIMQLFPNPEDKKELRQVMIERATESLPTLSSAETDLLEIYNKDPADLEDLFAKKGWCVVGEGLKEKPSEEFQRIVFEAVHQILKVYRSQRMALPPAPQESWIVHSLWGFLGETFQVPLSIEYHPAEYHCQASAIRRNLHHPQGTRRSVGHEVDGIAVAVSRNVELLVVEAAKKDEGQSVTKAVDDNLKICKLTKDMQDFIKTKAARNVREEITTFGIQISGARASFFSLRQRRGRFYQLCQEGSGTLPAVWADQVDTQCILRVLATVLIFRKTLLSAAEDIARCLTGPIVGSDPSGDVDCIAATLASPQLSPSSPLSADAPSPLRL
ncbi:hypothetical protein BGX34_004330, partial [Mortierella sp. NVP85]